MKCPYCGFEYSNSAIFCPNCGIKIETPNNEITVEPVNDSQNYRGQEVNATEKFECSYTFRDKVGTMLKSNLFLTFCILVSVYTGLTVISNLVNGGTSALTMPVLFIIATIFLWIIFGKAKRNQINVKNLRVISGIVFAKTIINWVLVGIFGLCGIIFLIFAFCSNLFPKGTFDEVIYEIEALITQYGGSYTVPDMDSTMFVTVIFAAVAVVLFIIAVEILLLNIFGMRTIHKFTKSFYMAVAQNDETLLQKTTATSVWLMIFGIFGGISSLYLITNIASFISMCAYGASLIIMKITITKYLRKK